MRPAPSFPKLYFPFFPVESKKKPVSCFRSPTPWWNDTCAGAVESRRILLRIYKSSPSLDNWLAFKRENLHCRRILRREKKKGWKLLCSGFSHKTPTAAIWKFIRAYKNKSLSSDCPPEDDQSKTQAQDLLLSKLCPPSCLHSNFPSLESLKRSDSPSSPYAWIDQPFSMRELISAIRSSRKRSAPGLDRFDYGIVRSIPSELLIILLSIYNDLYAHGLFPEP